MTFYVEKRLALGSITFGVSPGRMPESIDDDNGLSTGPTGEFVRHRGDGFFFGGHDRFAGPSLPSTPSVRATPFLTSLKDARGLVALIPIGALFTLLGFAVVVRKGPQGWVEVILGLVMIAIPMIMTAQKRRQLREQEERERAEREATEKKNREMLAAYTAALDAVRTERTEETFGRLQREREALTVPYEIWGPAARRTALLIGFDELARRGPEASGDVAQLIGRISRAAGLTPEDEWGVRLDLYRTILWHLLADDRLGESQLEQLLAIQKGLDVPAETKIVEEFQRLRGDIPARANCTTQLGFQESCIFETATDQGTLHVTNKRMILEGSKKFEMPITRIFDLTVNVDDSTVTVKTEKKPLRFRVADPITTAAMLDLASAIDQRPRGWA